MACFPENPAPSFSLVLKPKWRTIVSQFDGGKEQRRQKQAFAKYDVSLTYKMLTRSEMQALWNFYQARKGSYEPFYFYTPDLDEYRAIYVGTADGSSVIFDIPGRYTAAQTVYLDGSQQSGYTVLVGGGAENSDRILFTSPPPAGTVITCDFVGSLRIRCRFKEDEMSRDWFALSCYRTGLELRGLAPE